MYSQPIPAFLSRTPYFRLHLAWHGGEDVAARENVKLCINFLYENWLHEYNIHCGSAQTTILFELCFQKSWNYVPLSSMLKYSPRRLMLKICINAWQRKHKISKQDKFHPIVAGFSYIYNWLLSKRSQSFWFISSLYINTSSLAYFR